MCGAGPCAENRKHCKVCDGVSVGVGVGAGAGVGVGVGAGVGAGVGVVVELGGRSGPKAYWE